MMFKGYNCEAIMMQGLIPMSIFNADFGANNIGYCLNEDIVRLYDLYDGVVFVPDNGNLKYIPLIRRTRLKLIPVKNPKEEFKKYINEV